MHDFAPNRIASRHMAGLVLLLLALTGLAGCGQSRDDSVPPPDVDAAWVKATRKNATKVAAADTASTQTFDGWCDLQGTIIVTGDRPQVVERLSAADQDAFCKQYRASGQLRTEDLLIGEGGELANAAVYVTTKGVPEHPDYAAEAKKVVELDNHRCRFEPRICLLRTSQTLLLKNSDAVPHNTKFNSGTQQFSETIGARSSATRLLTREERRPTNYNCDFHKWMSGFMVLRASPYMAKTGTEGTFEIKKLPAGGTLVLELWHERARAMTGTVEDVQGATQLTLDNLGRLTVVLPKDGKASFVLKVDGKVLGGS